MPKVRSREPELSRLRSWLGMGPWGGSVLPDSCGVGGVLQKAESN